MHRLPSVAAGDLGTGIAAVYPVRDSQDMPYATFCACRWLGCRRRYLFTTCRDGFPSNPFSRTSHNPVQANVGELRKAEVQLPRTRVSQTNDKPQTTLAVAPFGFGPYRLSPGVPSSKANTKSTITPISGTKPISIHQPERSMSWSLLTVTAKVGMRTARL